MPVQHGIKFVNAPEIAETFLRVFAQYAFRTIHALAESALAFLDANWRV